MKTVLLVIDAQVSCTEILHAPLPKIQMLHEYFHQTSRLILFTQHGHAKEELVPPVKNQLIRKAGVGNALLVDSDDWKLCPEAEKMAQEYQVLGKNTYDAFLNTRLYSILRSGGVERVVVCGVKSDLSCNTTARAAFCRGFETWFVSDACGASTEEDHGRAVSDMAAAVSKVCTAAEALALLMED